jgi:hypothetical protein
MPYKTIKTSILKDDAVTHFLVEFEDKTYGVFRRGQIKASSLGDETVSIGYGSNTFYARIIFGGSKAAVQAFEKTYNIPLTCSGSDSDADKDEDKENNVKSTGLRSKTYRRRSQVDYNELSSDTDEGI